MNHFAPDPVTLQAEAFEIEVEDLDAGSVWASPYTVATGLACWTA